MKRRVIFIGGLYAPSHRDHYTGPLEANGERPYLDFWHWLLEHDFAEMHNGSFQYLWSSSLEDPETPEWVRTILKDIFETVKGHPACDKDGINFYVSW